MGNLSFDVTREELIEAFSAAGRVVDAKVPTDRETGRPRGFAFVEFESDEAALRSIEQLNGRDLKGRPLRVNEAENRPPRPPGAPGFSRPAPGGGGGFSRPGGGGFSRPARAAATRAPAAEGRGRLLPPRAAAAGTLAPAPPPSLLPRRPATRAVGVSARSPRPSRPARPARGGAKTTSSSPTTSTESAAPGSPLSEEPSAGPTPRTTVGRLPERARYDRDTIHAILDEGLVCHVGFVVGRPALRRPLRLRAVGRPAVDPRLGGEPDGEGPGRRRSRLRRASPCSTGWSSRAPASTTR